MYTNINNIYIYKYINYNYIKTITKEIMQEKGKEVSNNCKVC